MVSTSSWFSRNFDLMRRFEIQNYYYFCCCCCCCFSVIFESYSQEMNESCMKCKCGTEVETTEHFLLRCHFYPALILELFENLVKFKWNRSTQCFIIISHSAKSFNQSILNNVISYIKATVRMINHCLVPNNELCVLLHLIGVTRRSWNQSNNSDGLSFTCHLGCLIGPWYAWYAFSATHKTQFWKSIWLGLMPTVDTYPNINILRSIHYKPFKWMLTLLFL